MNILSRALAGIALMAGAVIYGTDVRPDEMTGVVGAATEAALAGLKALLEG